MQITIDTIALYELIKPKLGEKETKALVQSLEQIPYAVAEAFDKRWEQEKNMLATKEDIAKLETKIAEAKADLLKWMIVLFAPFYVGMIVFLIKQFL